MKVLISVLLVLAAPGLAAKESGLADYCGTLHFVGDVATVRLASAAREYKIQGSDIMPLERLRSEAGEGESYCIRAWVDYDDPNRLILYDFFPY